MARPDIEELIKTLSKALGPHHPTRGMQVSMGVTCSCGFWEAGRGRYGGSDGLDTHRAEVVVETLDSLSQVIASREHLAVAAAAIGTMQNPSLTPLMVYLQLIAGLPTIDHDEESVEPGTPTLDRLRDNVVAVSLPEPSADNTFEVGALTVRTTQSGDVFWPFGPKGAECSPESAISLGLALIAAGTLGKVAQS